MNTICISLERRTDRAVRVKEHLTHVGLYDNLIMMPAYDGAIMPDPHIIPPKRPYFSFKDDFGMPSDRFNRYQIACVMSHVMALKMAAALNLPEVLIVEDDVQFAPDRMDIFVEDIVKKAPQDWEMIYLGYAEREWAQKPRKEIDDTFISPGFCDGIHAYIANQKAYRKLANEMLRLRTTADDAVNDIRFRETNPLIAYAIVPKIAFQIEDYSEIDRKIINRKDLR